MKSITFQVWWFIGVVFVCILLNQLRPYDSTDDVVGEKRSGLALYTDQLTGCQYVKGGYFGGTTPRMDRTGRQICVEGELE